LSIGEMLREYSPLEDLGDAVCGDETESSDLCTFREFGRMVPPVHDEISFLGNFWICAPEGFDVAIAKRLPNSPPPDKGWVTHHVICRRPLCGTRIDVPIHRHPRTLIRDFLTCDRRGLH